MSETRSDIVKKILTFAATVEIGTGVALMIAPRIIVALLVGSNAPVAEIPMGRFPGIAIFALGVACWPAGQHAQSGSPAFRGMLIYNALIALFLVYLFVVGHLGGLLLWPGVVLHGVVALLLVRTWPKAPATVGRA